MSEISFGRSAALNASTPLRERVTELAVGFVSVSHCIWNKRVRENINYEAMSML